MSTVKSAETDRAIAAWVLGDLSPSQALAAICAVLVARPGVSGGLVVRDGDVAIVTPETLPARERRLLERVAKATAPWRAFHGRDDDRWRTVLGAEADRCEATWLASEPLERSEDDAHATLVVMGATDEHRDALLVALPALARACAPIVAAGRAELRVRHHVHRLKNGLAAILANVEYATDLAQRREASAGNEATGGEDLHEALDHAHQAAKRMTAQLDALAAMATSRRRE